MTIRGLVALVANSWAHGRTPAETCIAVGAYRREDFGAAFLPRP